MQAKSFDAPIKLLFPRELEEGDTSTPFSMLGLGDIVIPGIFVALILRYDTLYKANYFRRCVLMLFCTVVLSFLSSLSKWYTFGVVLASKL